MEAPRSASLYISGLPLAEDDSLERQLRQLFGQYGPVNKVDLPASYRGARVAFIHFNNVEHADAARNALHRQSFFGGAPITAKFKEDKGGARNLPTLASSPTPSPPTTSPPIAGHKVSPSSGEGSAAQPKPYRIAFVNFVSIRLVHQDICSFKADVLVNAANSHLRHSGGIAQGLVAAGGLQIQKESDEWVREYGDVTVGNVAWTSAGKLSAQLLLHAVGPDVSLSPAGYDSNTHDGLLSGAVLSALRVTHIRRFSSIGLPPISSGVFGFPKKECATVMLRAIRQYCRAELPKDTYLRTINIVILDQATLDAFAAVFDRIYTAEAASAPSVTAAIPQLSRIDESPGTPLSASAHGSSHSPLAPHHGTASSLSSPLPLVLGSYHASVLPSPLDGHTLSQYKAAGIIPLLFSRKTGALDLLLPIEAKHSDAELNLLGGQREGDRGPKETAVREFVEEVGRLVSADVVNHLVADGNSHCLWLGFGKYVLYVANGAVLPKLLDAPDEYAKVRHRFGAEADHLVQIAWDTLLAVREPIITLTPPRAHNARRYRFSDFLQKILACEVVRKAVVALFHLVIRATITNQRTNVEAQAATLSDDKLLAKLLGEDWRLLLETPEVLSAPIETLARNSGEWSKAAAYFGSDVASRAVSLRRVNVSARTSAFASCRSRMAVAVEREVMPVFHGTPERWRATAIALHGFDLSIHLNGRALGNGVYSADSVSIPLGYTGNVGSVLCMKGLVHGQMHVKGQNSGIYVFPDADQVLPVYIADFSSSDAKEASVHVSSKNAASSDELQRQRKAELEEVRKREAEYRQGVLQRWRKIVAEHKARLEAWHANARPSTGYEKLKRLARSVASELCQFDAQLPILEGKDEIVKAVRENTVCIITAGTGTGKSTQVPQYLLDECAAENETRRIAVLEPRRVNAIALSRRVAEERGTSGEIGYHLGRGDKDVSDDTRVEFMTHGLFVQLAQDPAKLWRSYWAVVVDEAHERSLDVDLSFAYLRRSLLALPAEELNRAKVIVMSATIEAESKLFASFLTLHGRQPKLLSVKGNQFPVHVEHRGDMEADDQQIGSGGVGKVLSSYALQTAVDIVERTEDGNVLVFLPGESHIARAIEAARTHCGLSATDGGADDDGFAFKKGKLTIGVYPFHGKLPAKARERVLFYAEDRIVIFATNVAETGLTIPNVRYVVDTGLRRSVRWDSKCMLSEMVTEWESPSAMLQRTGRAGRVATGVCVRLFSAERANSFPPTKPEVEGVALLSVALRLATETQPLQLLQDPPREGLAAAQLLLRLYGALNECNQITVEGRALLRLGLSLQLGRFLLAAASFGCLDRAAKLAAVLAVEGHDRLLPKRSAVKPSQFLRPSGDHLTLLHIFEQFLKQDEYAGWCKAHDFDANILSEARQAYIYISEMLVTSLKYSLEPNERLLAKHGDADCAILRALCSAYFLNLGAVRQPGQPAQGFAWLTDDARRDSLLSKVQAFAAEHGANPLPPITPAGTATAIPLPAGSSTAPVGEVRLKLSARSSLWHVAPGDPPPTMVVFSSVLLTDSDKNLPSVHVASYVTPEDVQAGAPEWCKVSSFASQYENSMRETRRIPLSDAERQMLLSENGKWIQGMLRRFPSIVLFADKENRCLTISASRGLMPIIVERYNMFRAQNKAEDIEIPIPEGVNVAHFIGKEGANRKALHNALWQLAKQATNGTASDAEMKLQVDGQTKRIVLSLSGRIKHLAPVLLGRIQTALADCSPNKALPELQLSPLSGGSGGGESTPWLRRLVFPQPPTSLSTRDEAMLFLAHAVIWKANCKVYGGFVRDWVVSGRSANDIDVALTGGSLAHVSAQLKGIAASVGIRCIAEKSKGQAHTLVFAGAWSNNAIEVDLVDPNPRNVSPVQPYVDADVGNMAVDAQSLLHKKVPTAGAEISLVKCMKHAQRKRFVFFYYVAQGDSNLGKALLRLKSKYFDRSWTCLNFLPDLSELRDSRNLIKPKQKYNKAWWQ